MTLAVAVVGAGKIGTKHARVLASFPDARVARVVDVDPGAATALADAVDARATDLDDALDACDAVFVCTPDDAHVAGGRRAIEAGLHTFVEKPLATTVADAEDLVAAAAAAEGVHAVGHVLRFDARYRALRADLEDAGDVLAATAERLVPRARVRRTGAVSRPPMRLGVHDYDLLAWLLDDDVESVRAAATDGALREAGYDTEDATQALLSFAGGATATVTVGFCLPDAHPGSVVRTTVVGSEGVASVDASGAEVQGWTDEGGSYRDSHLWPEVGGVPSGALAREDRAFVDAVRDGGPSPVPFAAGRDAVAVARAVEDAADGGATEWVP